MPQTTIQVQTPRGTMPVHIHAEEHHPDGPLVILFMDAPGIRPALHGHAQRLASAGYRAALPDLYYAIAPADRPRLERLVAGDAEEFARMASVVASIRDEQVLADTELMLEAIGDTHEGWGSVGFCMGARFAVRAAHRFGPDLRAASLLHPSGLVTDSPDSPHRHLDGVCASLYLGFGERDHVTPLSVVPPLREELDEHHVPHRIEVIPDADHGYTMPGMPAYNEAAAEQAWAGTMAVLGERLNVPSR